MTIVTMPLPAQLTNGTAADATQVMTDLNAIANNVNSNAAPIASGTLTGAVIDYAGSSVPSGYLLCDGSAVSRVTYATLFIAIGVIWGVGDGSTTFNVPDLRGRATIGSGTGSGLTARTLGVQNIGEETHALSVAELAAHSHGVDITDPSHTHNVNGTTGSSNQSLNHSHVTPASTLGSGGVNPMEVSQSNGTNNYPQTTSSTDLTGHGHSMNFTSGGAYTGITAVSVNTGSGTAHNNMQPSAVVQKIIKT